MMGWLEAVALVAFTAGLMGGLHCAAMCGGIVCLIDRGRRTTTGRFARWQYPLAYNAGRVFSYTLAGVFAGSVGQAGLVIRGSLPVQQVFMLAAGLTLCLMAAYLAGVTSLLRGLESAGALLWRQVAPQAKRMLPVDSVSKALGLGMVWGWMPCGMVYAALLLALSTVHPLQGALVMFAFGLGTLPNMLLMSSLVRRVQQMFRVRGVRLAAAALLAAVGLYGIYHGLQSGWVGGDGFFCRVAPAWFGG